MGSCGSWEASMHIQKKIRIKQEKENSSEDIKKFIAKHKDLSKNVRYKDFKKSDILLSVTIVDEDGDRVDYILLEDLGLENVNAKDFIDNKIFKEYAEFNDDDDDDYAKPSDWMYDVVIPKLEEKLKFLDLKKLGEDSDRWDSKNPNVIHDTQHLGGCENYIYCGDDNVDSDSFTITQKFIDSLSVGDKIILEGSGDGEHC